MKHYTGEARRISTNKTKTELPTSQKERERKKEGMQLNLSFSKEGSPAGIRTGAGLVPLVLNFKLLSTENESVQLCNGSLSRHWPIIAHKAVSSTSPSFLVSENFRTDNPPERSKEFMHSPLIAVFIDSVHK
mmetsp:Transcript_39020/g.65055  ORF Transcript_39020/g.65055 Transcript_39020/m.65055 type:complete len:132 (-) Transcript_39020:447-842(-)